MEGRCEDSEDSEDGEDRMGWEWIGKTRKEWMGATGRPSFLGLFSVLNKYPGADNAEVFFFPFLLLISFVALTRTTTYTIENTISYHIIHPFLDTPTPASGRIHYRRGRSATLRERSILLVVAACAIFSSFNYFHSRQYHVHEFSSILRVGGLGWDGTIRPIRMDLTSAT